MIVLSGSNIKLELPSPGFGNGIKLPLRVKAHRAMNGERYTYITTPVKATHSLSFSFLNNNQIEDTYQFIRANTGKYIQYNEIELENELDRLHTARILDTAIEFVHRARRDNQFSINLEVGDYANA